MVAVFVAVFLAVLSANAAEVKIFRGEDRASVLAGTLDALSVDPLGALALARRVERLATLEEPFVFTAAGHPDGWVLGTGNSGKVLLVDRSGGVSELYAASEPTIFAVESDGKGTVYAGSSPYGQVYRVSSDGGEAFFNPDAAYIWDLELDDEGRLYVATGFPARLYRVDPSSVPSGGSRGETDPEAMILFEGTDSHVRAVEVLADGSVLVGTAGQGLIVRIAPDGTGSTVYDSVAPEVLAFTSRPDGTVYAAVLASEASLVDLSTSQPPPKSNGEAGEEAKVTVVTQTTETAGSRSAGASGPRSLVLKIAPGGGEVEEVHGFDDETVHSLLWHDGELWIGTGEEGRVYRLDGERLLLERDLDERQVTGLAASGGTAAAVTTNGAALYHVPGGTAPEGSYTSKVLDAGQVARFGLFTWEGELPAKGSVEVEARSGMSSQPDATWTPWLAAGSGREVSLADVPAGRYVQWRAKVTGNSGPRITATELSYRQQNLRPKIKSFTALAPGEILVPANFTPQNQTFEPWSPNREGIFTSLRPEQKKNGEGRLKTLWKKGYRSLKWEASDANEDDVFYRLDFQRNGGEDDWLKIVEELDETYYSFDSTVLPDGVYRFRLTASDRPAQDAAEALVAEKLSEPVVVDHTPPRLVRATRKDGVVEVELADALSPLRVAEASADAGPWKSAVVADGLLDGRRETIRVEAPAGARLLLLRVTDAAWNVVTLDLLAAEK